MMVTFVAECEKKALKKTRRVLDAFANRIGRHTWQTVITEEGLKTVRRMLRKTASRHTAVSCHWIRSRARSQLLWVVGNQQAFSTEGLVPVNRTAKTISTDERDDWHYLPLIQSLTAVAALLHDWGKVTALFQAKLTPGQQTAFMGDPIRHEWVSLLLLTAFVDSSGGDDEAWLSAFSQGEWSVNHLQPRVLESFKQPFTVLPPVAQLVAWLILSHHRLPVPQADRGRLRKDWLNRQAQSIDDMLSSITCAWGYENLHDDNKSRLAACFQFPQGFLQDAAPWQKPLRKWTTRLASQIKIAQKCLSDGSYRVVLHHARLCLMLGDHAFSSAKPNPSWRSSTALFANTDKTTGQLKQKLDEHLVGVCNQAVHTAYRLPEFEVAPPAIEGLKLPVSQSGSPFYWQEKAVAAIKNWRAGTTDQKQGFFAVNMASTGKGKTFANAKIMQALSPDGKSLRFILALGLRTLTLQTGDEYRDRMGLTDQDLAVLIGSKAIKQLHGQAQQESGDTTIIASGSESIEALIDEDIDFDADMSEQGLQTVLTRLKDRQFLYAPVLACTIDHMMAATETRRGGRYILPSLRLSSSDLVIDEVDDFIGEDLIAIGRLIHLAGMLGRKVMISSATITPDIAEGFFQAYQAGWLLFSKTRDASTCIGCAWVDEFSTTISGIKANPDITAYREAHKGFIDKRISRLAKQPVRRKANIINCEAIIDRLTNKSSSDDAVEATCQQAYFRQILDSAFQFHSQHHYQDEQTGIGVSFGVIRMANIDPCVALSHYLLSASCPVDHELRVMAYHSRQILLLRHEQELHLDQVLKRKEAKGDTPIAFTNNYIRQHLQQVQQNSPDVRHLLFVLVATPVEEVGRDHDFDWAVIEPSSYRAIIQLAGRVRRHRSCPIEAANIGLLQYNWRGLKQGKKSRSCVFNQPGYEVFNPPLASHNLNDLIDRQQIAERLDAVPRIQKPATAIIRRPSTLAALEHYALQKWLSDTNKTSPAHLHGYLSGHWFLSALSQTLTAFRRQSVPDRKAFYRKDETTDGYAFFEWHHDGFINRHRYLDIDVLPLTDDESQRLWLHRDYDESVQQMAERMQCTESDITGIFGELTVPDTASQFVYNDQFGLYKK